MVRYSWILLLQLLLLLVVTRLSSAMAASGCPLDLSGSNITRAAVICSEPESRASCCRYINALIAVSIARYANTTNSLGVSPEISNTCLQNISQTLELYGMTKRASAFCGFGTKISANYECLGMTTVNEMQQSPNYSNVTLYCSAPLGEDRCKKCINAGILFLRNLVKAGDNMTLSICRDATFVAVASQVDDVAAVDLANCFFGVQGLSSTPVITGSSPPNFSPASSPSPSVSVGPSQYSLTIPRTTRHHSYHLSLVPVVGIAVTALATMMLVLMVFLIRRKSKQLKEHEMTTDKTSMERYSQPTKKFLMYEYMANGSLKDHLHTPGVAPLSWQTRIHIAIDVANALEYLHFYCDPPLCHRDIKSSNILLDENFVGKVADFGLAYASKDGSICFEPVNTEIRGTPGYMDPEYLVTQELKEKSDIYSYGVVLLELITSKRAIQDNKNLVESCQPLMTSESRFIELVDPAIGDTFDFDQLQTLVTLVKWCTHREGRARPSIKQVLRLLYECADPTHNGFLEAVVTEKGRNSKGKSHRRDNQSWDARGLASSSSTTRSYCSRSFLLENGSPQSPSNIPSV
ncbi:putative protein kinase RLK-Pelle-URK-1 family [Helianthus annuus]|nr:putative protein kinase RLK-Pelle-URK-1 family [Helianthus annuus]